ncbi:MAG: DUF4932 domain-containing protein [Bacteroidota bacterium]
MRLLVLLAFVPVLAFAQDTRDWQPHADSVALFIPEVSWSIPLALADDSVHVINAPFVYEGIQLSFALAGARDTLRIRPEAPGVHRVRVLGLASPTAVEFRIWAPEEVHFSDAYQEVRRGTSWVGVPEVYELVNVGFALTPSGRDSTNALVWKRGAYHARVMEHFGAFADHPFVAGLEAVIRDDEFVPVRQNGLAFRFEGDRIMPDSVYRSLGRGNERLAALVGEMEAFAAATGFRAFYADHATEYDRMRAEIEALVPVRQMWDWLETEFAERTQSYVTVFSPLTNGTHNVTAVRDGDHREIVAFVPAPDILAGEGPDFENGREIIMSRMLFTEYDHMYVNPAMDRHPEAVGAAMADVDVWNQALGYRDPYATFAEYMTWAVFLAYVDAHYPKAATETARARVTRFMERGRGFVRFGAFEAELARLTATRPEGMTLEELLPTMAAWAAGR